MLNSIENLKVVILHLNRDWNQSVGKVVVMQHRWLIKYEKKLAEHIENLQKTPSSKRIL